MVGFPGAGWILKEPLIDDNGVLLKGALILTEVDLLCKLIPELLDYFYIIERRGWYGPPISSKAHIKLVDDLSCWQQTKDMFPHAVLLDLSPPDFVNTSLFFPLAIEKEYTGIQIAHWTAFKRHELFVQAAANLKGRKFIQFGHFLRHDDTEAFLYFKSIKRLAKKNAADIWFPFSEHPSVIVFDHKSPEVVNTMINRCRMGILTTKAEGVNRFKMECMSADIPVLVASDVSFPTRKHINEKTGYFFEPTPQGLAEAVRYVEEHYSQFSPRKYVLENTGYQKSIKRLADALNELSKKEGPARDFSGIYWDGRNKMLLWGDSIVRAVQQTVDKMRSRQSGVRTVKKEKKEFFVTVIVKARNRQENLRACVDSILKLNYKNFNIVVLGDNPFDGTKEFLSRHFAHIPHLSLVNNNRKLPAAALYNLAAKHSKGDIIAFTDEDCVVDRNWLEELTEPFMFDEVMCVSGQSYKEGVDGGGDWISGYNMAFRSTVFHRFQFDPNFKYSNFYTENELNERLKASGFEFRYAPKAAVKYFGISQPCWEAGDTLLRCQLDHFYLYAKRKSMWGYFYRVIPGFFQIVIDLMKMGRVSPEFYNIERAGVFFRPGKFLKFFYVLFLEIPFKALLRKIYDEYFCH